jgi:radical SAM-linked protein
MNQSPALPLGCTSECEAVDIWLEEERVPDSILHDVEQVAPNGLQVQSILEVDPRAPSLQSQTIATEYDVILDPSPPHDDLQRSVQEVIDADKLPRHWRGKDYDLRPLIESLEVTRQEDGKPILTMILSARPGATGRPEEVIASLGFDPAHARIHRTKLILDSE